MIHPLPPPFPYFGGKRRIAPTIWRAFGPDVPNYVEPFAGSLGCLLLRPAWEGKIETVNELNPYISNFWRAVAADPEAVAYWADWPVLEADLHARHLWLRAQAGFKEAMLRNPTYYDPQIAGWWVWGLCAWIGHGWCDDGVAPSVKLPSLGRSRGLHRPPRKLPHLSDAGQGVPRPAQQIPRLSAAGQGDDALSRPSRQLPHLSDAGVGVVAHARPSRQLPHLGNRGRGDAAPTRSVALLAYFGELSTRLRAVRVTCGDWTRVLGESVTSKLGMTAVFLDPPYETGADLYGNTESPARAVLAWCEAHWTDPALRIALCGYADELPVPPAWRCVAWKQRPGYQSQDNGNSERERVWLSPACRALTQHEQATLFADADMEDSA